jgi:hypothetical protein
LPLFSDYISWCCSTKGKGITVTKVAKQPVHNLDITANPVVFLLLFSRTWQYSICYESRINLDDMTVLYILKQQNQPRWHDSTLYTKTAEST